MINFNTHFELKNDLLIKYLTGSANNFERQEAFTWIQENKEHRNYFESLKNIYELTNELKHSSYSNNESMDFVEERYLSKSSHFELLLASINNLLENRKKVYETYIQHQKTDKHEPAITSSDKIFLEKTVNLIEENLENSELNVTFIADKLLISRVHLYKKIKALSNLSPVDFINNIRLKKSILLLKNPDINISEVAYMVGFSDPKYFSKVFKKLTGKSPSTFKKTYAV